MKASIYYTFHSCGETSEPVFKYNDRRRLNFLSEKLKNDGHELAGVYISDRGSPLNISLKALVRTDAKRGCFDILYLYVYGIPVSISSDKLLYILDLPVNGSASIFD